MAVDGVVEQVAVVVERDEGWGGGEEVGVVLKWSGEPGRNDKVVSFDLLRGNHFKQLAVGRDAA